MWSVLSGVIGVASLVVSGFSRSVTRALPVHLAALLIATSTAAAQVAVPVESPSAPQATQTPPPVPNQLLHVHRHQRPPVFNRANEVMPSWLRVRGEFRERIEGFENAQLHRGT